MLSYLFQGSYQPWSRNVYTAQNAEPWNTRITNFWFPNPSIQIILKVDCLGDCKVKSKPLRQSGVYFSGPHSVPSHWTLEERAKSLHCCPTYTWKTNHPGPFLNNIGSFHSQHWVILVQLSLGIRYVERLIGPAAEPHMLLRSSLFFSLCRYNSLAFDFSVSQ